MLRNKDLKFLCQQVHIRIDNAKTVFTRSGSPGQVLRIPIAHFDGNYYAPPRTLADVEKNRQVVFRYCDAEGNVTDAANVNGSLHNIAGLMNRGGNVLGLMPHPERASESLLGSVDGQIIFESLIQSCGPRQTTRAGSRPTKARHD
jgi:phosphoribosylformylglycinamidine synthase I